MNSSAYLLIGLLNFSGISRANDNHDQMATGFAAGVGVCLLVGGIYKLAKWYQEPNFQKVLEKIEENITNLTTLYTPAFKIVDQSTPTEGQVIQFKQQILQHTKVGPYKKSAQEAAHRLSEDKHSLSKYLSKKTQSHDRLQELINDNRIIINKIGIIIQFAETHERAFSLFDTLDQHKPAIGVTKEEILRRAYAEFGHSKYPLILLRNYFHQLRHGLACCIEQVKYQSYPGMQQQAQERMSTLERAIVTIAQMAEYNEELLKKEANDQQEAKLAIERAAAEAQQRIAQAKEDLVRAERAREEAERERVKALHKQTESVERQTAAIQRETAAKEALVYQLKLSRHQPDAIVVIARQ